MIDAPLGRRRIVGGPSRWSSPSRVESVEDLEHLVGGSADRRSAGGSSATMTTELTMAPRWPRAALAHPRAAAGSAPSSGEPHDLEPRPLPAYDAPTRRAPGEQERQLHVLQHREPRQQVVRLDTMPRCVRATRRARRRSPARAQPATPGCPGWAIEPADKLKQVVFPEPEAH